LAAGVAADVDAVFKVTESMEGRGSPMIADRPTGSTA
jgi:hypothetical protein